MTETVEVVVKKIESSKAAYKVGFRYVMTVKIRPIDSRERQAIRDRLAEFCGYTNKWINTPYIPAVSPGHSMRGWNSTASGSTNFASDKIRCVYDQKSFWLDLYFKNEEDVLFARMVV